MTNQPDHCHKLFEFDHTNILSDANDAASCLEKAADEAGLLEFFLRRECDGKWPEDIRHELKAALRSIETISEHTKVAQNYIEGVQEEVAKITQEETDAN